MRLEPALCENIRIPYPYCPPAISDIGENTPEQIELFIWDTILEAFNSHCMTIQSFIGMVRAPEVPICTSLNRTERIFNLHPLFNQYRNIKFEFINAAELNSLDLVQAARIYQNVYPGGLWWFCFRSSIYHMNMAYRVEALPAGRCTLIASDAYTIEWCYGKIRMMKELLADFLLNEISSGNLDSETALFVASEWLFGTANRIYG